jgi:hypothetical protein
VLKPLWIAVTIVVMAVLVVAGSAQAVVRDYTARSAQAPMTCMPKPSACGFPDATNTGVPAGTPLQRVDGTVNLSTPGQVYSNMEVHGNIHVLANNVTIEKVRVITNADYAIDLNYGDAHPTGTVVRDVEIDMQGQEDGKGISFDNYTASRLWIHNGLDCAHAGNNVTITDSFCDMPKLSPGSQAHADGFQSDGGGNFVFRHNTIRNPNGQTAAILMSTNTGPIDKVVIDNNLMSGGGYTVYCGTDEGGVATHTTYIGNVISKEFFSKGGYWGPTTKCDKVDVAGGNVWDGNYVPPAGTPPAGTPATGTPPAGGQPGAGSTTTTPGTSSPTSVANSVTYLLDSKSARAIVRSALARELGRRYTRRTRGPHMICKRSSRAALVCSVRWTGRGPGGHGVRRYSGSVTVRRVALKRWRYSARIRSSASATVIKRERSV